MSKFFLLLLFFSSLISLTSSDDFNDFVYTDCSPPKYALGSPYQFNVESLLASLTNAAVFSSYANFTSAAASSSSPAYGLLQCRGDLPAPACASCVHSALSQLAALCPSAAGAAVQLRGCFLRYDNDSFLGKPDTGVLYKKCGPAAAEGYNSDLLAMREAAVAGLITGDAGGSYRVGAAGYVRAAAQCGGDQSPKQCDECVAAALALLRDACGDAVAGDAYLGKCYARCWSKTDRGDEAAKTVPIITSLVVLITVFLSFVVVFLSFLRNPGNSRIPNFSYIFKIPPIEIPPIEITPIQNPPIEIPPTEITPIQNPPIEIPPTEITPIQNPPIPDCCCEYGRIPDCSCVCGSECGRIPDCSCVYGSECGR